MFSLSFTTCSTSVKFVKFADVFGASHICSRVGVREPSLGPDALDVDGANRKRSLISILSASLICSRLNFGREFASIIDAVRTVCGTVCWAQRKGGIFVPARNEKRRAS